MSKQNEISKLNYSNDKILTNVTVYNNKLNTIYELFVENYIVKIYKQLYFKRSFFVII